jgi:hypothetical protein
MEAVKTLRSAAGSWRSLVAGSLLLTGIACADATSSRASRETLECEWDAFGSETHEGRNGDSTHVEALTSWSRLHRDPLIQGGIPQGSVSSPSGLDRYEKGETNGNHTVYRLYVNDQDRLHVTVTELSDGTFYVESWSACI